MLAYQQKWLPHSATTEDSLAQALFLENDNQEKQQIAINNGICMALDSG
ncbi:hypothetical protein PE36_12687 [Moritella sp. PE36]|nr:hypothetical protein [Moritella sp. PE36]EDM67302.1 hypothetical protein PE36_12687 [Moritella sp. PE36]